MCGPSRHGSGGGLENHRVFTGSSAPRRGRSSVRPNACEEGGDASQQLLGVEDEEPDTPEVNAAAVEGEEDFLEQEEIVPEEDEGPRSPATSEEDVAKPRVMRNPKQPTRAEREEHDATHVPPRE